MWTSRTGTSAGCWTSGRAAPRRDETLSTRGRVCYGNSSKKGPSDQENAGAAMPHTQSAKKRLRQNEKRRLRNRAVKKGVKVQLKKFLDVVKNGTVEQVQAEVKVTVAKVDRAAAHK